MADEMTEKIPPRTQNPGIVDHLRRRHLIVERMNALENHAGVDHHPGEGGEQRVVKDDAAKDAEMTQGHRFGRNEHEGVTHEIRQKTIDLIVTEVTFQTGHEDIQSDGDSVTDHRKDQHLFREKILPSLVFELWLLDRFLLKSKRLMAYVVF